MKNYLLGFVCLSTILFSCKEKQGTGLGLSLSYDIVKVHGGEIKVNTKENEGTEFTINLPVDQGVSGLLSGQKWKRNS